MEIDTSAWAMPPIFRLLQQWGDVEWPEMYRTFNMGVGMILMVGAGLPCLFYELTGFRCPGCGVSRMLIAIGHLEFAEAFAHNRFLFVTGPLILLYLACVEGKYVLYGSRSMGKWEIFVWIEIGLALAFGVLRNTVFPW